MAQKKNHPLINWRKTEGLSRAKAGEKLNVSEDTIRFWEIGIRFPKRSNLDQIYDLTEGVITAETMRNAYDKLCKERAVR
ncbi:helix-turn-helix transcriptional regulator [Pseudovibrio sp. POLY-S9]|uniref:helix-turn-helix domain-containing protein n=1 Tax=Pseudovibrio sp. POLY-S9 TaxID=1576596 RepID=UPI000AA9C7B0|nr:helix-turn-helix transcriptional regulator [Pseudovibrio sp. POLY-S9]